MILPLYLVIHTANILGIFTDPFEFEGDYGPEINPVRETVFELVVSKEALARNLTDFQVRELMGEKNPDAQMIHRYRQILVAQAIEKDREHGPTFSELITPAMLEALVKKQKELEPIGFHDTELQAMRNFITRYASQKAFRFFRNNPAFLVTLDKPLRDNASQEGRVFDLPILSSPTALSGHSAPEIKANLIDAIFNEKTFSFAKPEGSLIHNLDSVDEKALKQLLGPEATKEDLQVFCTPAGQVFFYWIYQSLNLHLIADEQLIQQINNVKEIFARTIGNPEARAVAFRDKLIAADSGVVFTQESDTFVPEALNQGNLYLPVSKQNPADGCYVFLRSDIWEADYEIIPISTYEGYKDGVMSVVLATRIDNQAKFLLASCHGHSTKPEDGRLQISLVMEQFHRLSQMPENRSLQLLIGIDANTKSESDVRMLNEHLDTLGLVATSVGPTTIKRRMVTAQHSKMGRFAIDEEDFLITLKHENGGMFKLTNPTVGFSEDKPDATRVLPNIDNPSDHYPVGAIVTVLRFKRDR